MARRGELDRERRLTSWTGALDAYEQRLDAQRRALDEGGAGDVAPFEPPVGLGPLPHHLLGRADGLLRRGRELQAQLEVALAGASREGAVVRRLRADHARVTGARFVDHSA